MAATQEDRQLSMKYAVELYTAIYADALKGMPDEDDGQRIGKAIVKAAEQIEKYIVTRS